LFAWAFGRTRRRTPFTGWRMPLVLAAVPTAATLVVEWLNPAWSSPLVRAVAAVPLGGVVGAFLAASLSFRGKLRGCERTPSNE